MGKSMGSMGSMGMSSMGSMGSMGMSGTTGKSKSGSMGTSMSMGMSSSEAIPSYPSSDPKVCVVTSAQGVDYPGNDIENVVVQNCDECIALCEARPDCNAFTFVDENYASNPQNIKKCVMHFVCSRSCVFTSFIQLTDISCFARK